MAWFEMEKQISELNKVSLIVLREMIYSFHEKLTNFVVLQKAAEPLNQIVNTIKPKIPNDDLNGSLEKIETARKDLNQLKEHLKVCLS